MARRSIAVPEQYPKTMVDLADRRTEAILREGVARGLSLQRIVQSAYMQGLCDAADALTREDRPNWRNPCQREG